MGKEFKLFENYVVLEVESLHDFQIFCSTRKIVEYEINLFWQKYARKEKIEFALTIDEFKKFYLNEK